jgi:carotenoid 1,2-hydratase
MPNPDDHCCLNVALYDLKTRRYRRWCMTERSQYSVGRDESNFVLGPSKLKWVNDCLEIDLDEWSLPVPQKVKGKIRVYPKGLSSKLWALDPEGEHTWGPIATQGRVEVELTEPQLRWKGHAYFDQNEGRSPINAKDCVFTEWDWSRALLKDGSTVVTYDVRNKIAAKDRLLGLQFSADSSTVQELELSERYKLKRTAWGLRRSIRTPKVISNPNNLTTTAGATTPTVVKTLEDTPFYSRNIVQADCFGESVQTMHETLHVSRLASYLTQGMLPFKMPRVR